MPDIELPDLDPKIAANDAGLRYVSDLTPGIRRKRKGSGFFYVDPNGKRVTDKATLKRIRNLVIPPAWEDVWICASPNGHIQATGRDARGRKQYRYHSKWREIRDRTKYDKLISFGFVLPNIRKRVFEDLQRAQLSHEKVLATVVRLLDVTHMRIGNEEYAEENHSYGLTTLQSKHVSIAGPEIHFSFRGKSGVEQEIDVQDRRLARIIRQCQELPGHELFHYLDERGRKRPIGSEDVNDYLRAAADEEFSAKDFRTWGGTVHAAQVLLEFGDVTDEKECKRCLVEAVKAVAGVLGNRPATSRKYYIDPRIFDAFERRELTRLLKRYVERKTRENPYALRPIEKGVHKILQETKNM
ncbi:MAG TPA: hypothetical protein VHA78_04090 [Candidatus Peribacteraceae bacterium]|nr:hypothetical protein [Candidatus Peribacteraceae bacterium]